MANEINRDYPDLTLAMSRKKFFPLWETYNQQVTAEPRNIVPSHIWHWEDSKAVVEMAALKVHGPDSDHRILVMKNPDYPNALQTNNGMIASFQCVLPGEKTPHHRHTPGSVRIVLEGKGGETFVDGVSCAMYPRDLIATPNWTWHGHDNSTDVPIIWIDILDFPLVGSLNSIFGENVRGEVFYPAEYPSNNATLPDKIFSYGGLQPVTERPVAPHTARFRYGWEDVEQLLSEMQPAAGGTRTIRYAHPLTGAPICATLDATVTKIEPNSKWIPDRASTAGIVVVLDGDGKSKVGTTTHEWRKYDVFTIPEWSMVAHDIGPAGAIFAMVTNMPVQKALGLYRTAAGSDPVIPK